jgi:hypothetical protein
MNKRMLGFIAAILAGLTVGLVAGWLLKPADAKDSTLSSLRGDYQADYVLMVAERYVADQNALAAEDLLRELSAREPLESVKEAMLTAQQLGYSEYEMKLLSTLQQGLSQGEEPTTQPVMEAAP